MLPGRTQNGVKNHWHATLRKMQRAAIHQEDVPHLTALQRYLLQLQTRSGENASLVPSMHHEDRSSCLFIAAHAAQHGLVGQAHIENHPGQHLIILRRLHHPALGPADASTSLAGCCQLGTATCLSCAWSIKCVSS